MIELLARVLELPSDIPVCPALGRAIAVATWEVQSRTVLRARNNWIQEIDLEILKLNFKR